MRQNPPRTGSRNSQLDAYFGRFKGVCYLEVTDAGNRFISTFLPGIRIYLLMRSSKVLVRKGPQKTEINSMQAIKIK